MKKFLLCLSLIPAFSYASPFGVFSKFFSATIAAMGLGYTNYRFQRHAYAKNNQNVLAMPRFTVDKIADGTLMRMFKNNPKDYEILAPQVAQSIEKMSPLSILVIASEALGRQRDNYSFDNKKDPALCLILNAAIKKEDKVNPEVTAILKRYFKPYFNQQIAL